MMPNERALKSALITTTALLLAACSGGESAADGAAALPEGHPPLTQPGPAGGATLAGTVEETVDAAGYTYVRLDVAGREVWSAGPLSQITVGETVALADPMEMRGFTSQSLGRTFDVIYFTGAFLTGDQAAAAGQAAGAMGPAGAQGTVLQAIPASGYVYLEVESEGTSAWLAGPAMAVEKGDMVAWSGGSVMENFASSSLGRTFERILFVDRVEVVTSGS